MRRSVLSAVLAAGLSLAACSDQPTEVTPPQVVPVDPGTANVVGCPVTPTSGQILTLVNELLPNSPLRSSLIAMINALPSRFQDRLKAAVRKLIFPIEDLILRAFYAGRLKGGTSTATYDKVLDLIEALHCYVGLTPPTFPATTEGIDIVARVVYPNVAFDFSTPAGRAGVRGGPAAVTTTTGPVLITISELPDQPPPLRTSLDQYPRFYFFHGATATGAAVVFNEDIIAATCLRSGVFDGNTNNLRLAHNIGPNFGDVEVLPRSAVLPVGLTCPDEVGSAGGEELGTFAWAKKLFLPADLHAASTAALIELGVGGTTKKFSEFGIVDQTSNPGTIGSVDQSGEPTDGVVTEAGLVHVEVTSRNLTPIKDVPVTFDETTVLTNDEGIASFLWDAEPGTSLTASVPNERDEEVGCVGAIPGHPEADAYRPFVCFTPHEVTFTAPAADDPLVLNLESVEKLPGGTQRFTVQSGGASPYVWSVNDIDGGNATYGVIVNDAEDPSSAEYTAPGTVPTPATFDVCARRETSPSNKACASVTITPVPSSGADVIVFNDVNVFDQTAAANANNIQLFKNLVSFTTTGTRNSVDGVLIHRGHGSLCGPDAVPDAGCVWTTFKATLAGEGSTVVDGDDITTPLTSIDADVKLIILVVPMESYSPAEVNSLKSFAGQGGRILFVGEHESFYGPGIDVENEFLADMGAVMHNTGGLVDCGRNVLPSTSLRSHQITAGLSELAMACASEVEPGPNDYALFYDLTNTKVLGAVAKIDLSPLPGLRVATPQRIRRSNAGAANLTGDVEVFSWGFRPRE